MLLLQSALGASTLTPNVGGPGPAGKCKWQNNEVVCEYAKLEVSAGSEHTCGLTNQGKIECFGLGGSGQSNGRKPKSA